MTENGAVTLIQLDDDDERAFNTDGSALPGVEVKVIDVDGSALPAGQVGKLVVRACSNFGGYLKRPQWNNTDAEGWFDTGDLGEIDARGCVFVHARRVDLIVTGGENVYPAEVERVLEEFPGVTAAGVFGVPDETWGQTVAAALKPSARGEYEITDVNAEYLRERVLALAEANPDVEWLVLNAEAWTYLDATSIDSLKQLERDLTAAGIRLCFARLKGREREIFAETGLTDQVGADRFYPTIGLAVHAHVAEHEIDWRDWEDTAGS